MIAAIESERSQLNCEPALKEINLIWAAARRTNLLHQKTKNFTYDEYQIIKQGEYATRQLLKIHWRLISKLITTYRAKSYNLRNSDLEQEATLAFIEAVISFDPSKGASLATWAYIQIRAKLQKLVQQAIRDTVAKAKVIQSDLSKVKSESIKEQVCEEQICSVLNKLTPKQRQVVSLALKDFSWAEIAIKLQSTQVAVQMVWNRAVKRLRLLLLGEKPPEKQQQSHSDIKEHQSVQSAKKIKLRSLKSCVRKSCHPINRVWVRLYKQLSNKLPSLLCSIPNQRIFYNKRGLKLVQEPSFKQNIQQNHADFNCQDSLSGSSCLNPTYSKGVRGSPLILLLPDSQRHSNW